jgi:hypothetical protein
MERKEVFILGSGFSRAIHEDMPLLNELTILVAKKIEKENGIFKNIYGEYLKNQDIVNFEEILTYLYQDFPWKSEKERHLLYSLYIHLAEIVTEVIKEKQDTSVEKELLAKEYIKKFLNYINDTKANVISLNYDTLLEDLSIKIFKPLDYLDLYSIPIAYLKSRTAGTFSEEDYETYRLLKLHGSTNWYYSATKEKTFEQIYLSIGSKKERELKDLVPVIIPPVLDKTGLFEHSTIKSMWSEAKNLLEEAKKVYIIGYSIPQTDLTVKFMLQSYIPEDCEVTIVNKDKGRKGYFKELFGKKFNEEFIRDDNRVFEDFVKSTIR